MAFSRVARATPRAVGFQLSGLSAGEYDIYVTARNTSSNANYTQTAYVGTSATAGNFVLNGAGMTAETLAFANASASTASWIEDSNYLKFTVTLGAGDVLNVATLGGGGEVRGFLNSVQIVAVPEPAISVMLGLSGGAVWLPPSLWTDDRLAAAVTRRVPDDASWGS